MESRPYRPSHTNRNNDAWAHKGLHDSGRAQDRVACKNCNAYAGDASCSSSLPVLCINKDGSSSNGYASSFYDGWAAGNIALTAPVLGTTLTSLSAANTICAYAFGPGWRMTEFHDGQGGWGWRAYGNINNTSRFWVYINDQNANCWNSNPVP